MLEEVRSQLRTCAESLKQSQERLDQQGVLAEQLETRCGGYDQVVEQLQEAAAGYATQTEVQNMIKDILLIWNSLKNLDSAKADRKDLDALAVESLARAPCIEDLQKQVASSMEAASDARCSELGAELHAQSEATSKEIKHWEEMWDKLAGHVEELATQVKHVRCGGGDGGGGAVATSGGYPTPGKLSPQVRLPGGLPLAPERLEGVKRSPSIGGTPATPPSVALADHVLSARGTAPSHQSTPMLRKSRALAAAEDKTPFRPGLETAMSVSGVPRQRPSRPRSASLHRRSHDQGMLG